MTVTHRRSKPSVLVRGHIEVCGEAAAYYGAPWAAQEASPQVPRPPREGRGPWSVSRWALAGGGELSAMFARPPAPTLVGSDTQGRSGTYLAVPSDELAVAATISATPSSGSLQLCCLPSLPPLTMCSSVIGRSGRALWRCGRGRCPRRSCRSP